MDIYKNSLAERCLRESAALARRLPVPVKGLVTVANLLADYRFDFTFDCEAAGVRWSSSAFPDKLTRHLLVDGTYQHDVVLSLRQLLRPGQTVFDVGAHHGLMAVVAGQRVGPSGRVVAFEPNPAARRFLPESARLNGLSNVRVEPIGVTDVEGELDFYPQVGSRTWNSSFVREFVDPTFEIEPIRVPVTTIDAYVKRSGLVPDLIKIDTEGTDGAVLVGARSTIEEHRPILITELNATSAERAGTSALAVIALLERLGYTLHVLRRSRFRKHGYAWGDQRPFDPAKDLRPIEVCNVICVPRRDRREVTPA